MGTMRANLRSCLGLLLVVIYARCATAAARACNNSPLLCDRPFNKITHLGAHDSPFARNASNAYIISGDQYYNSIIQLDAGVRLLTAQVHAFNGITGTQYRLCHTSCILYDAGLLSDWLSSIKGWLDRNPNEVVSILLVNSDDADASTFNGIFQDAGVIDYAYVPTETTKPLTKWPTLDNLISTNKRLMVFIASLDPSTNNVAPYLLDEFTFMFENNYDVSDPRDFSCEANRPDQYTNQTQAALASGRFALMNHFLYHDLAPGIEVPSPRQAEHRTNRDGGPPGNLGDTADKCTRIYGAAPVFIIVDFFNDGPAIATIDRLNGVKLPMGRKKVPEGKPSEQQAATTTKRHMPTASGKHHDKNGASSSDHAGFSVPLLALFFAVAVAYIHSDAYMTILQRI